MKEEKFDLVVIGSGPGGYVAALRAAQLGFKTACIEKDKTFGGTCLNVGCIPSKALLESSYLYYSAKNHFQDHGVDVGSLKLQLSKMLSRKEKVVHQLTKGIGFLFKKAKVKSFYGTARFESSKKIILEHNENNKNKTQTSITFRHAIIATGSVPASLPKSISPPIDEEVILSSTGALSLKKPPKTLVVIGGGFIGLELGSVWSRLGSQVKVIEFADKIISSMDDDLIQGIFRSLKNQGLEFYLNSEVKKIELKKNKKKGETEPSQVKVKIEKNKNGNKVEKETLSADALLLSVGRKPYTNGLGLEEIGVKKDPRGFVQVDENYKTEVNGIYAIGDVIGGLMLAHKAESEGKACVELISGQKPLVSYHLVPSVVYTHPEVASVGSTEEELKKKGLSYQVGKFSYRANGRALSMGETEGFVKILSDSKSHEILGAHVLGASASEIIHEFCLSMEFSATWEDLALTMHAHPTLSEVIKEAALSFEEKSS